MILTAHQPSYLPYLGLLSKIASADMFCLFDIVPMESSGWENRNQIKTAHGPQLLTVPVRRGRDLPIKDVEIARDQPWQRKHWRSLELAYQKAPFFEEHAKMVKELIDSDHRTLADLGLEHVLFFCDAFGIQVKIVKASNYSFSGTKSDLVLDMCRQLGATTYIFGSKGRDYADVDSFHRERIAVEFQEFSHPVYPQIHGEFLPNMSALDLLFNVGAEEGKRILLGDLREAA